MLLSFTGYVVSLTLRLLGGENYLTFPAAIAWPWYDEEANLQHFPFRTVSMLAGLIVNLIVSYLFKWLFESAILDAKHDRFNAVVNERHTENTYNTEVNSYTLSTYGADNPALAKEAKF